MDLTCHCAAITHRARCKNCFNCLSISQLCSKCKITCQNCIIKYLFKDKLHLECRYNEKLERYTLIIYGFYDRRIEYIIPLNYSFEDIYCHDNWHIYIPLSVAEKIYKNNFFVKMESSLFVKRNLLYFFDLPSEIIIKIIKNMFY